MGTAKRSPAPPRPAGAAARRLAPGARLHRLAAHHSAFSQVVISFHYRGKLVGQTPTACPEPPEGRRLSLSRPACPEASCTGALPACRRHPQRAAEAGGGSATGWPRSSTPARSSESCSSSAATRAGSPTNKITKLFVILIDYFKLIVLL